MTSTPKHFLFLLLLIPTSAKTADVSSSGFGAEKGKVIYLDKGNRFIRMR